MENLAHSCLLRFRSMLLLKSGIKHPERGAASSKSSTSWRFVASRIHCGALHTVMAMPMACK